MQVHVETNKGNFKFHIKRKDWMNAIISNTTTQFLHEQKLRALKRRNMAEEDFTSIKMLVSKKFNPNLGPLRRMGILSKIRNN